MTLILISITRLAFFDIQSKLKRDQELNAHRAIHKLVLQWYQLLPIFYLRKMYIKTRSMFQLSLFLPVRTQGRGVKSTIRLPYPQRVVKTTKWGGVSESPYRKCGPCRCRTGTFKNPTKCLWRWEPDRRYNFFFSPPAHLCRHIYEWNIVACDV